MSSSPAELADKLSPTNASASQTDLASAKSPAVISSGIALSDYARNSEKGLWWRPKTHEQKLLLKLDFYIMSWACFGYFLRLLDTSNMTNAYVSGMKEDLGLLGDQIHIGMIPSQIAITRIRPSIFIPSAEILWAILTFCFAAVKNEKQIYAMRFLIGLFEAPFYVGAMTLLGNWYTPTELGKRASIFYSASFVANMFSGYLQAAVYKGLNGTNGLAGWRWLFIMCGIITVPGALWGLFTVPDSPYKTRVWYLTKEDVTLAKSRMVKQDRRAFKGIEPQTFKKVLLDPWALIFIVNYIFFCIDTTPLSYFAIWIKSLKHYSVSQINIIPTGAYGIGFVSTILFGFLSDRLRTRPIISILITITNVVSSLLLATHPSRAGIFYGYFTNAATYAYGPIMISWLNEYFGAVPDERALILGIAQTMGATFNTWVPLLIFNTGTQAPLFHTGFIVCTVVAVVQIGGIAGMWWLSGRGPAMGVVREEAEEESDKPIGSNVKE
ncbi:uncharacterized protein PAC_12703 [Phialocephala subalpina]|uniref:Transporter protein n=1 Tax=Phialocephala subalpina TaxID=576137 RepID=A0A1L7XCT2_9HELO|nr:uncharacterized protein PAC_12703 [Phialocephala subalpina]